MKKVSSTPGDSDKNKGDSPSPPRPAGYYPTTSTTWWEIIRNAGIDDEAAVRDFYCRYKEPILTQFRKYHFSDPEELCSEFFEKIFYGRVLQDADRTKGKFRSFLATILRRFMIDKWRKGERDPLNKPAELIADHDGDGEGGMGQDEFQAILDQGFAQLVVGGAFAKLREQYQLEDREKEFEYCIGALAHTPLEQSAKVLKTTPGNMKQWRSIARGRLRDALLKEVEEIVPVGEREEEIRYLMRIYRKDGV